MTLHQVAKVVLVGAELQQNGILTATFARLAQRYSIVCDVVSRKVKRTFSEAVQSPNFLLYSVLIAKGREAAVVSFSE